MLDWFLRKDSIDIKADIHSHLLPGLDDGVKTYEESLKILKFFESQGYQKVITTPHINPDLYPNTEADIRRVLEEMRKKILEAKIKISLEAAAEYYIGPELLTSLNNREKLLSFGKNYVLIETSFYSKPLIFEEVIFKLKSNGYLPVLAHPERYQYLTDDFVWLKEIREKGVKLQVTVSSLVGMYGRAPKELAEKLLKKEMVDFLGSDIHRENQIDILGRALRKKIKPQRLLNNELV